MYFTSLAKSDFVSLRLGATLASMSGPETFDRGQDLDQDGGVFRSQGAAVDAAQVLLLGTEETQFLDQVCIGFAACWVTQATREQVRRYRQADIGSAHPQRIEFFGRHAHGDSVGFLSLFTGAHDGHYRQVCRGAGLGAEP